MTWFKVDDNFAFHHKAMEAGNAALGLWVRAGSYCAQQLTDGFVPHAIVRKLGTKAQARRLVNAKLWHEVRGGFVFHEFTDNKRNPTANAIRTQRDDARERQAKRRDIQTKPLQETEPQVSEPYTDDVTRDSEDVGTHDKDVTPRGRARRPDQTRPDLKNPPYPPDEGGTDAPRRKSKPRSKLPLNWQPKQKHRESASQHGIDVDREVTRFRQHADATGRLMANWDSAFSMWLDKARDMRPATNGVERRDPRTGMNTSQLPW